MAEAFPRFRWSFAVVIHGTGTYLFPFILHPIATIASIITVIIFVFRSCRRIRLVWWRTMELQNCNYDLCFNEFLPILLPLVTVIGRVEYVLRKSR